MKENEKIYTVAGAILFALIILITALLLPKKDISYSVTFKNDNTIYLTSDIAQDKTVTKPNDPVKEGYNFLGWYYNDTLYDFTKPITGNIELEAKWEEIKVQIYTVTFDTDGGNTIESIVVNEGSTITETIPTKEGYNFLGWYYNDAEFDFTTKIESDITLKAKWEETKQTSSEESKPTTPVTKKYTVKFDSNGGSKVSNQTVEENKTAPEPTNPTRTGYTFKGWTLNNQTYDFSKPVTKDITLKAKWEEIKQTSSEESEPTTPVTKKYTVKFDSNGGSKVSNQTVEENKTAPEPTNPTRTGYTFKGWTLNNQTYDFSKPVTKDITLKAKWEEIITYKIEWKKIDTSSIGEYYLYIIDSKGRYVSGKVEITTIDDETDTKDVPSTGLMLIKSEVKSAKVKSVD